MVTRPRISSSTLRRKVETLRAAFHTPATRSDAHQRHLDARMESLVKLRRADYSWGAENPTEAN
jgi:hypothetical protein